MAYNLNDRFPPPPKHYKILDPTSYQNVEPFNVKPNKVAFLSGTKRKTQSGSPIWTHKIYYADKPAKIPNCTSMMSKQPRFPYELLSKKDLDDILCRCGIQNVCKCSELNENGTELKCHGKIHKRLYKGHPPKPATAEGLSVPSRRDHGYQELSDGTLRRIFSIEREQSSPFYDAAVYESTAFYHGWKWSQWKTSRTTNSQEQRPGPADYTIERPLTSEVRCAEKVREGKRKKSKQLRYIEMVERKNIMDGFPGPNAYNPQNPKGMELEHIGPKAEIFRNSIAQQYAGPADHWIKRDFDPPAPPLFPCHAVLPEPSFFGVKATRFKPLKEEGPGPANYSPKYNVCKFMHCPTAGFGSSSVRFKDATIEEDENKEITDLGLGENKITHKKCPTPTWEFKSKTIRMPPLVKKPFEQSPADLPMFSIDFERPSHVQYKAPFWSSEGRFQPWCDWLPIIGNLKTPGPAYYHLGKPRCQPAVCWGPLFRAERFPTNTYQTPAPNEYRVGGGVETVLATHNQRLKHNIKNQHKFHWKPPVEPKSLSLEERQILILQNAIELLEIDDEPKKSHPNIVENNNIKPNNEPKTKLLRCFLNSKPSKVYF